MWFMDTNKQYAWYSAVVILSLAAVFLAAQQEAPVQSQQTAPSAQQPTNLQQPAPAENTAPQFPPTSDPKEIVRRSVEVDHRDMEMARNYTCQQREVVKHLGKQDEVKSTEIKTYDVNFYYGYEYSRLTQVNDKPLSEKEQKKEDEKLEKFLAKHRNESEEDRQKHLSKEKKEREESRAFARDIVNAFDFRMVGDEQVEGVDTWVIEATPRKDFHPTQPHADILKKVKGKMWIEKKEYNWIRVQAETLDTISFGLFLARVHPGSRFEFQQTRLNNEVWLIRRFYVNGSARFLLVKNEAVEQEDTFSNYKKFSTSVRIVPGVKEVKPEEPPK
jgi:hypothetical protein